MNNYNTMYMTRGFSPFATAGSSAISSASRSGLLSKVGGSKITLSGILNGAQKTIGTVNQIVPLYNQVKPLFQNSKVLVNVAKAVRGNNNSKGLFTPKRKRQAVYQQDLKIDIEEEKEITVKEETKNNENEPSKPFFI